MCLRNCNAELTASSLAAAVTSPLPVLTGCAPVKDGQTELAGVDKQDCLLA